MIMSLAWGISTSIVLPVWSINRTYSLNIELCIFTRFQFFKSCLVFMALHLTKQFVGRDFYPIKENLGYFALTCPPRYTSFNLSPFICFEMLSHPFFGKKPFILCLAVDYIS